MTLESLTETLNSTLTFVLASLIEIGPHDKDESTRFANYGRAVVVFFTGYAASKLDVTINAALSSSAFKDPDSLTWFRILAFTTTVLLVTKVTFACRSYDSPHLPHPEVAKEKAIVPIGPAFAGTTTAPAAPHQSD